MIDTPGGGDHPVITIEPVTIKTLQTHRLADESDGPNLLLLVIGPSTLSRASNYSQQRPSGNGSR